MSLTTNAVASKCAVKCLNGESGVSNSPSHIKEYIEGTIERLGFTPDLYYLHRIDPNTPLTESIPALDQLRKEGKTKYIGISECSAKTLRNAHSSESANESNNVLR
jgi:aryl-alcohol dehydrogenase-like predicted oxidoreductase